MAALLVDEDVLPLPDPLAIRVQPATENRGPPDAYKNASEPRGAVFIANYRHFDDEAFETREGSELDVQYFRDLFSQMGYKRIGDLESASMEETLKALKRFRDDEIHNEVDSLIVTFMSHGWDSETFCTTDGKSMCCKELYSMFNNLNCPALSGKPKLFIFQFCRGKEEHIVASNGAKESAPIDAPLRLWPLNTTKRSERRVSDIFICFSTLPGFVSYRHEEHGSHYINMICRVFMDHAKDKNFDGLMKLVNRKLPDALAMEVRLLKVDYEFFFNPPACQGECVSEMEVCPRELPCTQGTEDTYKNSSDPRGLVLIVNNLPGCQEDVGKLSDVFSGLGYKVLQPLSNLTQARLKEELERFKQTDQGDSAIVIFYGDGFEDCLVSSDGKILTFRELTEMFSDIQCPNLAGKPKLFILNTCYYTGPTHDLDQGHNYEAAGSCCTTVSPDRPKWSFDGGVAGAGRTRELEIPAERDMILLSVEADTGCCDRGSLLTEALYQILKSADVSMEISPLLRSICRRLDALQGSAKEEYFSEVRSIKFRRDFYFNPPKPIPADTAESLGYGKEAMPKILRRIGSYPSRHIVKQVKQQPRACEKNYTNFSDPHGLAIIVSYDKYESKELPNCLWRKEDATMLGSLMNKLGYRTELYSNISNEEMKDLLREFKDREEHYKVDSMIFIVLGLARDQSTLYSASGAELPVEDIYQHFTDGACPALKGKPKIFFFHMTKLHDWKQMDCLLRANEDLHDAFILRLISKASPEEGLHPSKGLRLLLEAVMRRAHDTHLEGIVSKAEESLDTDSEKFSREYRDFKKIFFFNPKKVRD